MTRRSSAETGGSAIKSALAGSGAVGVSLLVSGLLTYVFLTVAARELGPDRFAPFSVLWSIVMIVGPGLFLPIQQELARGLARHRNDRQGRAILRMGVQAAALIAVGAVAVASAASVWVVRLLFDGQWTLMACLIVGLLSYAISFICRGFFAGLGQFERFGSLVVVETLIRLVLTMVFWVLGWRTTAAFAVAVAVAPAFSAILVSSAGRRLRLPGGGPASRREFGRALGWLLLASTCSAALANAGPMLVQYLDADAAAGAGAGSFLAALLVARISLYLFQAVQASLLPNISELIAEGRLDQARRAVLQLSGVVGILIVVAGAGGYVAGPGVLRLMFGDEYVVSNLTMCLLALGTGIYILAIALAGPTVAASAHRLHAGAWLVGCVGMVAGLFLSDEVFLRVEIGYVLGSAAAAAVLLAGLPRVLRRRPEEVGTLPLVAD